MQIQKSHIINNDKSYHGRVDAQFFYSQYTGHSPKDLSKIWKTIKKMDPETRFVFFAGDSSLDNKFWVLQEPWLPAVNGLENILKPPQMKPDVSYHLNALFERSKMSKMSSESKESWFCINGAVEESALSDRQNHEKKLLEQDQWIRRHITNRDVLVVSVGGNDIALKMSASTILHLTLMVSMNSIETLENNPKDAWGFAHFVDIFGNQVQDYICQLLGGFSEYDNDSDNHTKRQFPAVIPYKVIVCMIYFPDCDNTNNNNNNRTASWADKALSMMQYDKDPRKLKAGIRALFHHATSAIKIPGVTIIPFPMFEVLDGSDTMDYVASVEPSHQGGQKLAKALFDFI